MIVFLLAVLLLVIGAVVAVVLGRTGGMSVELAEPVRPLAPLSLPDGPLGPDDLATVRLDRAIRGYRMDQVDDLLDRLRLQLAAAGAQAAAGAEHPPYRPEDPPYRPEQPPYRPEHQAGPFPPRASADPNPGHEG